MALIFTFPCGGCGRRYSVYYPKALMYELSGSGTRQMGAAEDEAERASGAIEAARSRVEARGDVWVDASERLETRCACGKRLDFNLQHHPRVPVTKPSVVKRQTGLIPFPTVTRPGGGSAG